MNWVETELPVNFPAFKCLKKNGIKEKWKHTCCSMDTTLIPKRNHLS